MAATEYDCVYYYTNNQWKQAQLGHQYDSSGNKLPDLTAAEQVARIKKMGYPAVPGKRSIGAPEGPPR